jgi:peptidoglycan/xylan/chitin deacetylase (PgdA/CDA1 family)
VALAFDDGPWILTSRFVAMLHRERAVATFFMIGRQITRGDPRLLRRELRDGDALGDHTWSHPYLTFSDDVRHQLSSVVNVIRAETGYTPCVFRPPYGVYDPAIVHTARSLGLATVLWDVDPRDWALPGTAAIEQRVLAGVRRGSIVISHDGGGNRSETLAAYPHIIAALRARGYRFVTVPQLLGFRPVYTPCRRLCFETAVRHPPPGSIVRPG